MSLLCRAGTSAAGEIEGEVCPGQGGTFGALGPFPSPRNVGHLSVNHTSLRNGMAMVIGDP